MRRLLAAAMVLAGAMGAVGPASSSTIPIPGNVTLEFPRKSMVDLRFTNVIRQAFDLSCGAAAVATLLTYFYGDKVDEKVVIEESFKTGDKAKIEKDGFSMLELKNFGDRRGYVVRGFKINDVKALKEIKVPFLTLVNSRGYNHFVIVKGVKDGEVFIADSAFGNRSLSLEEFGSQWNSVILVFLHQSRGAQNKFLLEGGLKAPIGQVRYVLDQYLGRIRPGAGEF